MACRRPPATSLREFRTPRWRTPPRRRALPQTSRALPPDRGSGCRRSRGSRASRGRAFDRREQTFDVGGLVVVDGAGANRAVGTEPEKTMQLPRVVVAVPDRDLL